MSRRMGIATPLPLRMLSEADFQATVLDAARTFGWRSMHVRRAVARKGLHVTPTSVHGWPDLVLWHPTRGLVMVELKAERGVVTPEQRDVLGSLHDAGARVAVWKPRHLDDVILWLRGAGVEMPGRWGA